MPVPVSVPVCAHGRQSLVETHVLQASEICELSINTRGTRPYAEAVANVLDPDKKLFGSRIASR